MNYFKLVNTIPEVLDKMKEAEKKGDYAAHLDAIDFTNCYPVDEKFPYVPTGKIKRKYFWDNLFVVRPFCFIVNHFLLHTRVFGRENLKGVTGAVITCNHVNKLDAVAVKYALGHRRLKVMVGDFNNQKGRLGNYMRAFGILPFSANKQALKSFHKAVSHYVQQGTCILFFPEGSEWWCYRKPRPYHIGAFYYAVKNHVPVMPMFITFAPSGKKDENGIERPYFQVHVLKPIYPEDRLGEKENMKMMLAKNCSMCKDKYEEVYGEKLEDSF